MADFFAKDRSFWIFAVILSSLMIVFWDHLNSLQDKSLLLFSMFATFIFSLALSYLITKLIEKLKK